MELVYQVDLCLKLHNEILHSKTVCTELFSLNVLEGSGSEDVLIEHRDLVLVDLELGLQVLEGLLELVVILFGQ